MRRIWYFTSLYFLLATSAFGSEATEVEDKLPAASVQTNRATVKDAVASWETSTGVRVSPSAYKELEAEWLSLSASTPDTKFKPELARAYLYELRDQAVDETETPKSIHLNDMKAFSFTKYARMSFIDKPVGFLRCNSNPTGGSILIDGRRMGETVKDFTLAVGTYQIQIELPKSKCVKQVSIEADNLDTISCP